MQKSPFCAKPFSSKDLYTFDVYTFVYTMRSINEASILCNTCNKKTVKTVLLKNNFQLRTWKCKSCNEQWIHPLDEEAYNRFLNMQNKQYSVKLRLVGNSYTVSIPKEIIDFQENIFEEMDNLIKMSLESPEKLSLFFSRKL